eukprot:gene27104-biopygen6689
MLGVGVAASGIWQEVETESGSAARFKLVSWQKMYTVIMSLINSLQGIQFWNELTFSSLCLRFFLHIETLTGRNTLGCKYY